MWNLNMFMPHQPEFYLEFISFSKNKTEKIQQEKMTIFLKFYTRLHIFIFDIFVTKVNSTSVMDQITSIHVLIGDNKLIKLTFLAFFPYEK